MFFNGVRSMFGAFGWPVRVCMSRADVKSREINGIHYEKVVFPLAVFLVSILPLLSHAIASSWTNPVVARGQKAEGIPSWPKGVLRLINDPLRTGGWNPGFSECPNDGYYFGMDVRQPEDVNHLIKVLAAIEAKTLRLNLDPAEGAAPC